MIQSHELPERMVEINGIRKYRVNVKEVVREDTTSYTYDEVEFNAAIPIEISDTKVVRIEEEIAEAEAKAAILKAIDTMRVEVDGLAYDGNEPSQARMDRAIQTLVGDEPITWRMYDNSTETLTQTHLGKALRAAGVMQTKLWFCTSAEEVETLVGADTEWYAKYSGGEA